MKKSIVLLLLLFPILQGCVSSGRTVNNSGPATVPTEIVAAGGITLTIPPGWVVVAQPGATVAFKLNADEEWCAKVTAADLKEGTQELPEQSGLHYVSGKEKAAFLANYMTALGKSYLGTVVAQNCDLRDVNGIMCVEIRTTTKRWGEDPVCIVRLDTRVSGSQKLVGVTYDPAGPPELAQEVESIISSFRLDFSRKKQ